MNILKKINDSPVDTYIESFYNNDVRLYLENFVNYIDNRNILKYLNVITSIVQL